MIVAIQMMAVVALIHGFYFAIKRDVAKLGRFAGKFAVGMMLVVGVLYGLFIGGETFAEPGEGNNPWVLTATWVVPLIVMSLLAWKAPKVAKPILIVFFVATAIANLITLFMRDDYMKFFNTEGPWLGVGSFAFTIATTIWGYNNQKLPAGIMNMTTALLPMLLTLSMGEPSAILGAGSSAALLTPGFIAGLLLVISQRLDREDIA